MKLRVVVRGRSGQQSAPFEDVVAGQGDEHCVLDVVVKGVAVADAFEREPRGERDDLGQARVRDPEPVSHVVGQKRAKSIRRQAGQRDHHGSLRRVAGDRGRRLLPRALRVQHAWPSLNLTRDRFIHAPTNRRSARPVATPREAVRRPLKARARRRSLARVRRRWMNRHHACIGRGRHACGHRLDHAVDGLVAPHAKNCGAEDRVGVAVDDDFHESLRFALSRPRGRRGSWAGGRSGPRGPWRALRPRSGRRGRAAGRCRARRPECGRSPCARRRRADLRRRSRNRCTRCG